MTKRLIGQPKNGAYHPCSYCGKQTFVPQYKEAIVQKRGRVFCSKAHANAGRGERVRKTRQYKRGDGYIAVYQPDHPDASSSGWMLEHRLVAEETLGRRLEKHEHVHHLNHQRDDNRPENLKVLHAAAHAVETAQHAVEMREAQRREIDDLRQKLAQYEKQFGLLPFNGTDELLPSRYRVCLVCEKDFTVSSPNAPGRGFYCSDACRLKAMHTKRHTTTLAKRPPSLMCHWCAQAFYDSGERYNNAKYCCKACADVAKATDNPEKPCERCGTMFKKRFRSETEKARYCSLQCAGPETVKGRNERRGYVNPEKPCERCGTMFRKRWASETANARFCSDACACRTMTEHRMARAG